MATLRERVLELLDSAGPLDDDEVAERLGVVRQQANHSYRRLEQQGLVHRRPGWRGKIVNSRTEAPRPEPRRDPPTGVGLVTEDEVKEALKQQFEAEGYEVIVMWGRDWGIDIDALRGAERLVVEAMGEVTSQPQQTNYFLGALGELVQRMSDDEAMYGLAFPDNAVYRGLVRRLPPLARARLCLRIFFVARTGAGLAVTEDAGPLE
jgi:hypothetical protein